MSAPAAAPAITYWRAPNSVGKPRARQDLLEPRVATKAVDHEWVRGCAVHVRVTCVDGLRQPFQGKVLLAGIDGYFDRRFWCRALATRSVDVT
jgi:hypothetical protein